MTRQSDHSYQSLIPLITDMGLSLNESRLHQFMTEQYPYVCLTCGPHPTILFCDANRKSAFHVQDSSKVSSGTKSAQLSIPQVWSELEMKVLWSRRFGDLSQTRASSTDLGQFGKVATVDAGQLTHFLVCNLLSALHLKAFKKE